MQSLTNEKNDLFDQLQLRQAELESSQSHLESLESQTTELQFQVREAMDRVTLLNDELADARRDQELKLQGSGPSPEEVTRIISASEAKHEARIADLRRQLTAAERERDEGEIEWSRKLSAKVREIEALKGYVSASTKSREEGEENVTALKEEIGRLEEEMKKNQSVIADMRVHAQKLAEIEVCRLLLDTPLCSMFFESKIRKHRSVKPTIGWMPIDNRSRKARAGKPS